MLLLGLLLLLLAAAAAAAGGRVAADDLLHVAEGLEHLVLLHVRVLRDGSLQVPEARRGLDVFDHWQAVPTHRGAADRTVNDGERRRHVQEVAGDSADLEDLALVLLEFEELLIGQVL